MIKDLLNKFRMFLYSYFHVEEHNSTLKREVLAGITNYFTLIYLVMLVPELLVNVFQGAVSPSGQVQYQYILENGYTVSQMLIGMTMAAFIAAGIGSVLMGMLLNLPFVQGPSLAIGTFITYTVCREFGYSLNEALAIVFISGILFFFAARFGLEHKIHNSLPKNLKFAVTGGIGLFIAYTGIQKAHIITYNDSNLVNIFDITDLSNVHTKEALLAIGGLLLVTVLLKKNVHGAIFIGKIVCIILAVPLGLIASVNFNGLGVYPNIGSHMFMMDFQGLLIPKNGESLLFSVTTVLILLISICIMDIFETMGTIIAVKSFIKISREGQVKRRIPQILEVDAVSTSLGAVFGATTISTYVESTTGVIEGGRTGITAVTCGILFMLSAFIAPVMTIIPSAATASTLMIAGILMMNVIKHIDFVDPQEAVPAFLTMFLMPLTNSLLLGISFGIISYVIINVFTGRRKKINLTMYILTFFFLVILFYLPQ